MQQMFNFNRLNNIEEVINSLLNEYNEQKSFILSLGQLINFENMQLVPTIELINNNLPYIMEKLGLPFCDLMSNDIINYYINIYKDIKTPIIKNILFTFIKTFNFQSINKTPAETLIEKMQNDDIEIKQIANGKRAEKNEIEEMYDTLKNLNLNENDTKLLTEKIDDLEKRNAYPKSTIQYIKERLNLLNNKKSNLNNSNFNNIINNNNLLYPINMNINNTFNAVSNGLTTEEINELREIPLKERTYLYLDEDLNDKKNDNTVFLLFSKQIIDGLKRIYCGFLNGQGGYIYIGVNGLGIVKGLNLDYKQRDTIRNELVNYSYDFFPKCRIDKINVYFIEIKSTITKNKINNLYVIKINVKPGEPYNLYSLTSKEGFISTQRVNGQLKILTAEEIHKEIMRRGGLLKQNLNNGQKK